MNEIRALIAMFCVAAGGFHLGSCVLFLAPINPLTKYYQPLVSAYIGAFFDQDWKLFAPAPPTSSVNFWFRCEDQRQTWSEWQDPILGLYYQHKTSFLTYRGKLSYIPAGLAKESWNLLVNYKNTHKCEKGEDICLAEAAKFVSSSVYTKTIQDLSVDLCKTYSANHQLTLGRVQVLLAREVTKPFSKRHETDTAESKMARLVTFELPPFSSTYSDYSSDSQMRAAL